MTRLVRQAIVAVYPATFPSTPDWPEGPLPLAHGTVHADGPGRSTYYPPRTARLLYGAPGSPRRWHKTTGIPVGAATVLGIEALRVEPRPGAHGLVMIHLRPDDPVAVARALAGRDSSVLTGLDLGALLPGIEVTSTVPFTLAFVTPSLRISADWCGMVLRDGMALVGTRPDQGSQDAFYNHAALYARSLYLDAIVLGQLQLQGIADLEESLASAMDASPQEAMGRLEKQITIFRHQLWWQHLSTHGIPNLIIAAFHRQHRLPERFDQVLAEINDFNRLARDDDTRKINSSLMLLTLFTVPVGIGLAVLQVLGKFDARIFAGVIAVSVAVSLFLTITRPGRRAVRSTRRRLPP